MSKGNPVVRFRLPEDDYAKLEKFADELDLSVGATVREVLRGRGIFDDEPSGDLVLQMRLSATEVSVQRSFDPFTAGEVPVAVDLPPLKEGEEKGADELDTSARVTGAETAPPSPSLSENPLAKAARQRREWKEMAASYPALAREIGSFEEFVRRNP